MLKNPQNPALLQEAQRYTEDFAAIKGIFEGLYIATPDTYVLTHTSQGAIGITTRSGDSLEEFQNTILAEPELTNLGIMKSPGTGSMILSMYYPIFDGRTCIGFVGAGVYASHLTDELLGLNTQAGTYSFQDEAGVRQLVAYKYLADRNWVFMVHDNAAEVYEKVAEGRTTTAILCAAVTAVIVLTTLLILYREGRELMVMEHAIRRLGNLELSADQDLKPAGKPLLYGKNSRFFSQGLSRHTSTRFYHIYLRG